ncbi:GNAT family N-acetyltransferase [Pseudovibrio exalbescens]|uniref:GNAT family N-acetyltransferase n=1 Tax=Pseudovibrio exalbescens TaxID=197461 RepID=UPI002365EB56|nr:GNAT family N-acetyltransferase [Pseudovibrio exalbescens]MDD7911925.1 GNAT family N-acetyltransferase [Pseudovibrio exalbescens]
MRIESLQDLGIERGVKPDDIRAVTELYVRCLASKILPILGDYPKAVDLFEGALNSHQVLIAKHKGQVVGVLGLKTASASPYEPTLREAWRILGVLGPLRLMLLGLLDNSCDPQTVFIDGLAVHEEARSLGIGSLLLSKAEEIARTDGKSFLALEVINTNPRAEALYLKHGFRRVAEQRLGILELFFDFSRAAEMRKSLV